MAARVIKTHPKPGTVSRQKIRAAVRSLAKPGHTKFRKGIVTKPQTASGRGEIAFRNGGAKSATL